MAAESSGSPSSGRSLRWGIGLAAAALVFVAVLGALIYRSTSPLAMDTWWAAAIGSIRSPLLDGMALTLNVIGAGVVGRVAIPAAVIVALLVFRRMADAFYFLLVTASSTAAVGILKDVVDRERPADGLVSTASESFPSGHATTAGALMVAAALILKRVWFWVLAVAYILCMMISRTYLSVHWLTDTIAGALVGAAAAVLLYAALDWYTRKSGVPRVGAAA